ncbi:MAG: hypothetical protein J3R72DRAFT_171096 [Linnemannia gamsii]|nr:MAG: hypothetical protein J3R72DRAFT_171096 [Linnemannia gamsii]
MVLLLAVQAAVFAFWLKLLPPLSLSSIIVDAVVVIVDEVGRRARHKNGEKKSGRLEAWPCLFVFVVVVHIVAVVIVARSFSRRYFVSYVSALLPLSLADLSKKSNEGPVRQTEDMSEQELFGNPNCLWSDIFE